MKTIIVSIFTLLCALQYCAGQETIKIKVIDLNTIKPIPFAQITANNIIISLTDSAGRASVAMPIGKYELVIKATGYKTQSIVIQLPDSNIQLVKMEEDGTDLEEVTIVSSTRNNQLIENNPLKVEVLGKEEVSEEVGIKPGNIASILGDVSGVQIQQSSAVSGSSNVRLQGLQGRYTQILRDGMPLFDGFSGGFGILTIPPLDLKQIELIKGSASTLFGGGAIGGCVNLISKKPTFSQEADIVLNYSTLSEFDQNIYLAERGKKFGYSLFEGIVHQNEQDVNSDGFSDVPNDTLIIVHPKLFYYPNDKTIISAGYTLTMDNRNGGDMQVLDNKTDSLHRYFEHNGSERHTGEYSVEYFSNNSTKLMLKGSLSYFTKNTLTNSFDLIANQTSYYNEASFNKTIGKGNLVAGVNIVGDNYKTVTPTIVMIQTLTNFTTGAFAQFTQNIKDKTIVEGGMRMDYHTTYGVFALPRIAMIHRFNHGFATRLGFGMGYKTPNPLAVQDIDYVPVLIQPVDATVKAELSYGYNAEINYKKDWDKEHTLFINHAFFLTQVDRPIVFKPNFLGFPGLANEQSPLNSIGFDTYLKLTLKKWEVYGGFTFTHAERTYLPTNKFVPLTPKARAAFVLVKEIAEKWRFGLEGSVIGAQYRYDGTQTPTYIISALMVMHNIGKHLIAVANVENLLNYKMSNIEPIYTGTTILPDFKPLWAPIDGRVANVSLRWKL